VKTGIAANLAMCARLASRARTRGPVEIIDRSEYAKLAKRPGRFPKAPLAARTIDGIVFDSKKEATRYATLRLLERAGKIEDLRLQQKFPVEIGGERLCVYSADFVYWDIDLGREVIEDVKSTGTAKDAAYRLRKRAAELSHGIKIDEVLG
jgi:hypothetical protein